MKRILIIPAVALAFFGACSGGAVKPTLEENLLDYPEVEMVTFDISGTMACSDCPDEEPIGVEVEARLANDPLHSMGVRLYDGMGPFHFSELRGPAEEAVEVLGTLRYSGFSRRATANANIPGDDGGAIGVTLNFATGAAQAEEDDEEE